MEVRTVHPEELRALKQREAEERVRTRIAAEPGSWIWAADIPPNAKWTPLSSSLDERWLCELELAGERIRPGNHPG